MKGSKVIINDLLKKMEVDVMRKRTHEQIMDSKAIYKKHASAYKAANYPEHRAKRMLAYTAHLNKVIALKGVR